VVTMPMVKNKGNAKGALIDEDKGDQHEIVLIHSRGEVLIGAVVAAEEKSLFQVRTRKGNVGLSMAWEPGREEEEGHDENQRVQPETPSISATNPTKKVCRGNKFDNRLDYQGE